MQLEQPMERSRHRKRRRNRSTRSRSRNRSRSRSTGKRREGRETRHLWAGDLPADVTERQVREVFEVFGKGATEQNMSPNAFRT